MKPGYCLQCPKRHACGLEYDKDLKELAVNCKRMKAELWRIENPKRKGRIEIIYESDMKGTSAERFENCVYGTRKEKPE